MRIIQFRHKGNFSNLERFIAKVRGFSPAQMLEKYGQAGVKALSEATPVRTGETAASWGYEIEQTSEGYSIYWTNTHTTPTNPYINVAVILQYGHGTRNGGYVQGIDYINPALRPVFEKLAKDAWEEVTLV